MEELQLLAPCWNGKLSNLDSDCFKDEFLLKTGHFTRNPRTHAITKDIDQTDIQWLKKQKVTILCDEARIVRFLAPNYLIRKY